jgi:phosphate transport system permease protein
VENPASVNSRKTTFRVKATDKAAGVGIRVGGLGVILAVLGLIVFIGWQVVPLFADAAVGEASPPVQVSGPDVLVLHTDEYRRVGVCIERSGQVTTFSVSNGQVMNRFKPAELGDAVLTSAFLSLRPRTKRKIGAIADVPQYHLLLATNDGRVFVGHIAFVTDFLSFELDEEPADLAALARPEEDDYKAVNYVPEVTIRDGKLVEHVPTFGLYRTIEPRVAIEREMDVTTGGRAIKLVSGQISSGKDTEARTATTIVVSDDGKTRLVSEDISYNRIKKAPKVEADTVELTDALAGAPDFALVNELQDEIILAQASGDVHYFARKGEGKFTLMYPRFSVFQPQFDTRDGKSWRTLIDEQRDDHDLPPISDELRITAVNYLLGDGTIVFGDSRGGLQCWFGVIDDGEGESRLRRIRSLEPGAAAITSIQASPINKAAVVIDADGNIRAINNTAERVYVELTLPGARHAIFNRKGNGILALDGKGELHHWWVDAPHSEVSWTSLFGEVWYEDYAEPKHEWQSTGGTDDVEPKLSMLPLMKGTLKGALYALLFAIPLGVLAAIYTSEFMHRNMRSILKPTMEVMASLPSVVLGFLAALYFAPEAAIRMPTLLVALVMVPAVFMVFGWLWQRCPPSLVGKFGYWRSTIMLFLLLGLGIWLSTLVGPRAEVFLFPASEGANPALLNPETFEPVTQRSKDELAAGDFRTWTGGGQPLPRDTELAGRVLPKGWWIPGGHNLLLAILTIPLALLAGLGARKLISLLPKRDGVNAADRLRRSLEGKPGVSIRAVGVDAGLSLAFAVVLLGIGYVLALGVTPAIEWLFFSYDHPTAGRVADFRRAVTGEEGWKFEQANSLVVGFAMGFAVIPIIYTIAEDALTSVPNQLRAASLACGASRWQTTTRVVLPAAASGIFSGIVIGLGRALGETMIVVMAAGATPLMDLQPLSGFRSLSAAIAIEMPEAPHGGTLYRTLFLGGLLLFCMAFVINTVAEVVRMRLRRRLSRL